MRTQTTRRPRRRSPVVALGATLALAATLTLTATGCSATQPAATHTPTPHLSGTLVVFAAASLTKTFTTLGATFEHDHPGTTVTFSFAGSSDLVTQLIQGAPADVFASADQTNMAKATAATLVAGTPTNFATNVLDIAVPPSNPAHIRRFADLAKPGIKTVVCAPQVPCGAAAVAIEKSSGIHLTPASEESSVTDVLGKVEAGEADAGLVYATDVAAAGTRIQSVPFPEARGIVNRYPVAALSGSRNPSLARAFDAFVAGPRARTVLAHAGFGAP